MNVLGLEGQSKLVNEDSDGAYLGRVFMILRFSDSLINILPLCSRTLKFRVQR